MARTKTDVQQPAPAPDFIEEKFDELTQNANELVAVQAQQDARVRAVALRLGYQLPGESTDADLIQRDISANMRRSVEACFEVGKGLAVLRECCPHGQFMARLDVLGIEHRVAQRFMASAVKFSNAASTPLLKAIGNQSKLFEMLVLDDEQIEELELTGQTGELTLDDVATMSVKELRAALREERQNKAATEQLLTAKNKKIDELTRKAKKFDVHTDWPEELQKPVALVGAMRQEIRVKLGAMVEVCQQAMANAPQDAAEREVYDQALRALAKDMQQHVAALREEFEAMESTFLPTLGALLED